ncbi:MAG: hypothetical protein CBD31_05240 [Flavobacteriaceae bacterium TMED171]|nr:hypothetical protein [Flavobacteriaceae bacterium]OUW31286.1 MAG: hypothetical protein CBD31_05240 [Flavobacteriaceae bacterium TMED171]
MISCSKEKKCVTIEIKEESGENYYFYFRLNYRSNSQPNYLVGVGLNSEYAFGKVSKEMYDKYSTEDEYCF